MKGDNYDKTYLHMYKNVFSRVEVQNISIYG